MTIPTFQVSAFTGEGLRGNPATVCLLDQWLDDGRLQHIAAETNVSETAFLVEHDSCYALRWFTPEVEVDLCGHATLASGFVVLTRVKTMLSRVCFTTASGVLSVERSAGRFSLDVPARPPKPVACDAILAEGLGVVPQHVMRSRDLLAVFDHEAQIRNLTPRFDVLATIPDVLGVIVTAPGTTTDFVSRFFAPAAGISEDPVTGSAHCTLVPYWAARLGKTTLHAYQLSERGGELFCEDKGDRIAIAGRAVLDRQWEMCGV